MPRKSARALACALAAGAALSPGPASAQSRSPALRVHAIFSGARSARFHAGQALFTDVRSAGGRKLARVCFSPPPIARPACSAAHVAAASQPGPLTITATLDDGTTLTGTFTVRAAETRVGGPIAVPATITCQDARLFGNYDRRRHRSRDLFETMSRGTRVGLYNRIAPGKIFMWDYATNRGGFATESCAKPGL